MLLKTEILYFYPTASYRHVFDCRDPGKVCQIALWKAPGVDSWLGSAIFAIFAHFVIFAIFAIFVNFATLPEIGSCPML